jgi:hypothetical protein
LPILDDFMRESTSVLGGEAPHTTVLQLQYTPDLNSRLFEYLEDVTAALSQLGIIVSQS